MDSKSQGLKNPQFSSAGRSVPLDVDTAKELGGGARGRTLAIIYRQLCYWSKYAKWKGSKNRKFFYKSQRELAEELGYSEKTINRAIKALRELGLIVVEQLHKRGIGDKHSFITCLILHSQRQKHRQHTLPEHPHQHHRGQHREHQSNL